MKALEQDIVQTMCRQYARQLIDAVWKLYSNSA